MYKVMMVVGCCCVVGCLGMLICDTWSALIIGYIIGGPIGYVLEDKCKPME